MIDVANIKFDMQQEIPPPMFPCAKFGQEWREAVLANVDIFPDQVVLLDGSAVLLDMFVECFATARSDGCFKKNSHQRMVAHEALKEMRGFWDLFMRTRRELALDAMDPPVDPPRGPKGENYR